MRIGIYPIVVSLILLLAIPLSSQSYAAIRVIVNDVPITDYDITQRARLITLTERKSASVARRQAKDELVDDQVKLAEAKRLKIDISTSQVDSAYARIARNVKMSPSQLSTALRRGGVQPTTLKSRLKAQLAWNQLVQSRFRGKVKVDESDILAALKKIDEEERLKSIEYDLQRVIVVVPKNSSGGFKSKRRSESNKIRAAFNGCETAGDVLGKYSEVVVQPIGRRLETEVPEGMREEIGKLEVGRLTRPTQSNVGYQMIAVCGKREIASDVAVRTDLENQLRAKEGESQSRRYLLEIKRRATIVYP